MNPDPADPKITRRTFLAASAGAAATLVAPASGNSAVATALATETFFPRLLSQVEALSVVGTHARLILIGNLGFANLAFREDYLKGVASADELVGSILTLRDELKTSTYGNLPSTSVGKNRGIFQFFLTAKKEDVPRNARRLTQHPEYRRISQSLGFSDQSVDPVKVYNALSTKFSVVSLVNGEVISESGETKKTHTVVSRVIGKMIGYGPESVTDAHIGLLRECLDSRRVLHHAYEGKCDPRACELLKTGLERAETVLIRGSGNAVAEAQRRLFQAREVLDQELLAKHQASSTEEKAAEKKEEEVSARQSNNDERSSHDDWLHFEIARWEGEGGFSPR